MKAVRFVIRLVGWLLTPIVGWAASFLGASAGAWLTRGAPATRALWITIGLGGLGALLALVGWLRLLRRSPRLRHALEVAEDGTPIAALEAGREGSGP
jgi:hypothetical protein